MKYVLLFLGLAVASASGSDAALKVRFGVGLGFFIDIPLTMTAAMAKNWVTMSHAPNSIPSLVLCCESSTKINICAFYDQGTGFVAGLQVCLAESDVTRPAFDWKIQGFTEWWPRQNQKHYCISQYYVSVEYMQKTVAQRTALASGKGVLHQGAVWLTGINGKLLRVSEEASELTTTTLYTKQNCVPFMGRHYFFNMSSTTPCTSECIFPWFTLAHSGKIIGSGSICFVEFVNKALLDIFETPNTLDVKAIVNNGPQCIYDMSDSHGAKTMHIYYIDKPWFMGCLQN